MADIGPWDTDEALREDVDALQAINDDLDEPTGFIYSDPQDTHPVSLSFVNGTRTLTVAPSGSDFSFYIEGTKYTKSSSETIQISNDEGLHYVYYDETGELAETTTFSNDLLFIYAYVTAIYWDATNSKQIHLGREPHGSKMSGHTHENLHETRGAQIEGGGGGLGNISADDAVPDANSTLFSITQAILWDEDLSYTINAHGVSDNIAVYYKSGADASDIWRVKEDAANIVIQTGGVGEDRAAYNQNNGGTWQLTEATNNKFILAHVFVFNDTDRGFGIILGQNQYNTKSAAQDGAIDEIGTLNLRGTLGQEFKFLATVIIQTNDGYSGNPVYSRIVSTAGGDDFVDLRSQIFPQGGSSSSVTDHGALGGLTDLDHPASAIYTDTANFDGILSAADTTVQAALDTLDGLSQNSITDGNYTLTVGSSGLTLSDDSLTYSPVYIQRDVNGVVISDTESGEAVRIDAYNSGEGLITMINMDPEGEVGLSYAGEYFHLRTYEGGIIISDSTNSIDAIFTGVDFRMKNYGVAGLISLLGTGTGPVENTLAVFDPDGAAGLYYAGTAILSTTAAGISITDGSATAATIVFSGDDLVIQNNDADGLVQIYAEQNGGGASLCAQFDPDGGSQLYYLNGLRLRTSANGFDFSDGTSYCLFTYSGVDVDIENTAVLGKITLAGNIAGPTEKQLASFDPAGAAGLYYAGVLAIYTDTSGARVATATNTLNIDVTSAVVELKSTNNGTPFRLSANNNSGSEKNGFYFDPDVYTLIYHKGVLCIETFAGGFKVYNSTATANTHANIRHDGTNAIFQNRKASAGAQVQIQVRKGDDTAYEDVAIFTEGGSSEFYYDGVAILATTVAGISITDGTATAATIVFSSDDLYITNNDADGEVYITAEKTGTGQSTLFHGDPDGAASLYYANTLALVTNSSFGVTSQNNFTVGGTVITDGSIAKSDGAIVITPQTGTGVKLNTTASEDGVAQVFIGSETNLGQLVLYGGRTSDAYSAYGGIITLYTADDHDTTIPDFQFFPYEDDFWFYSSGGGIMAQFVHEGSGVMNFTLGVDLKTHHVAPVSDSTYNLGGPLKCYVNIFSDSGGVTTCSCWRAVKDYEQEFLGLDFINSLIPVAYKYKEEEKPDNPYNRIKLHGFLFDDLLAVREQHKFLLEDFAGIGEDGEVQMTQFIAPIVKSIQELTERVEALENLLFKES